MLAWIVCLLLTALATTLACFSDPSWNQAWQTLIQTHTLHPYFKSEIFWGIEHGYIAKNILSGHGFSGPYLDIHTPTAVMPPLIPYFYYLMFTVFGYQTLTGFLALFVMRIVLLGSALYFLYRLVLKLNTLKGTPLVTFAIINCGLIFLIAYKRLLYVYYDEWILFFITAMALLQFHSISKNLQSISRKQMWGWGTTLGVCVLSQPVLGFAMSMVTLLIGLIYRSSKLLLTFAILLVLITPWTIRNYIQFQDFIPIKTSLGFELYYGNVIEKQGIHREEEVMSEKIHPYFSKKEQGEAKIVGEKEYIDQRMQDFLTMVRHQPRIYLSKIGWRILYTSILYPYSKIDQIFFNPQTPLLVKFIIYPIPFISWMFLLFLNKNRDTFVVFLTSLYGFYFLPYLLINFWMRYWIQVLPLISIIVFLAYQRLAQHNGSMRE